MKIEIDLKDIMGDEYGDLESLAQSIERQLVDTIQANLAKGIQSKIDEDVSSIISDKVKEAAEDVIPQLMVELVDTEYTPVGRYGSEDAPTTMRKQLHKALKDQMVYKASQYNSDKNSFTRNIDTIISEKMAQFKKDFDTKVDEVFTKEAFDYAITKMNQKLRMCK